MSVFQIDRLYEWKQSPQAEIQNALKKQKKNTKDEFEERTKAVITEFAEQVSAVCGCIRMHWVRCVDKEMNLQDFLIRL